VLLTELRILIVDTGRVWWRQLPMIMGVYLLGWLGTELHRISVGSHSAELPRDT
jgi:hypothetical protein